jgi:hypothetical protein
MCPRICGDPDAARCWRHLEWYGHGDDRSFGKPLFQIVILSLAFRQTKSPAAVMDDDGDLIWIVEGRCDAIERGIVEVPLRRRELPDELRKIMPVFVVALAAASVREHLLGLPDHPWGTGRHNVITAGPIRRHTSAARLRAL